MIFKNAREDLIVCFNDENVFINNSLFNDLTFDERLTYCLIASKLDTGISLNKIYETMMIPGRSRTLIDTCIDKLIHKGYIEQVPN